MSKLNLTSRNEIFNQQVEASVVYGKYDLSACSSGSFQMGVLYPIYCRNDIVPGDKFELKNSPFLRMMPLVSPAMVNVDVEVRYFFIPRRILWSQWKNFISPSSSEDVLLEEPYLPSFEQISSKQNLVYNVAGSIYDYMGQSSIPWNKTGGTNGVYGSQVDGLAASPWTTDMLGYYCPAKLMSTYFDNYIQSNQLSPIPMSAFPYLAYNFVWNEYFRDENLQQEALCHLTTPGPQHPRDFFLRRVNWQKDYFTGGLPWVTQSIFSTPQVQDGMTIEQLREESALTKWLELQAIGGHRYQESILTHFGVRVPDEAAQIPVYLGGGKCPVMISDVEQTSSTSGQETPLATLGGKGTAGSNMFVDKVEFKEHGTVLGLMYIRPKALYADVTPKDLFKKDSRHDYIWPAFVNLGDEAVKARQLSPGWFDFDQSKDFCYQMRYAAERTSFDQVHGELRPLEPLESWTLARSWSDVSNGNYNNVSAPLEISDGFITCHPSSRIFAVDFNKVQSDSLIGEIVTLVEAVRPLPSYVDPKLD